MLMGFDGGRGLEASSEASGSARCGNNTLQDPAIPQLAVVLLQMSLCVTAVAHAVHCSYSL